MSAGDFAPKKVEETRLMSRLKERFADSASTELGNKLAQILPDVCKIAADRLKLMPSIHGEFTLHDEVHFLRVVELMARVMPEQVISDVLNPVEIALLILSAFFHDSGMVLDKEEAEAVRQSAEYQLLRQNWLVEFAGFSDTAHLLENKMVSGGDLSRCTQILAEFEQCVFARFIRSKHAQLSSEMVKQKLGKDDRLRVGTGHLAGSLALLCISHSLPAESITEAQGFHYDKAVGTYPVNLAYLASVLRLADILDFDRERTPDELYRCINLTNPVSIQEWEKHRQVEGWKIDRDAVRFECACERPEYEHAIRRFLRFIDDELAAARDLTRRFPAPFAKYAIDLPTRTDGSRVRAKDGAYLYVEDLEISLKRDEIVRLLMTEKMYGHPSLAIRELLQNAWDALRHRGAIMKRDDGVDWPGGIVEFEHGVNEHGREFVRCTDNGVGMDHHIVKDFLLQAGRSYYRSPEFERERLTFARANADFDPCARFGIGFMSLFMLGDKIVIQTRRYGGSSGGLGEPLVVEINGIGSLVVLRRGLESQPSGTSIIVTGRRKPERFATWNDRVRLVETLYAYALAGEFPVRAKCSIHEIKDSIEIPNRMAEPWHPLVEFNVKNKAIFEQDFIEVDRRLRGKVACGVPVSDGGKLAVANAEAGWRQGTDADFFITAADKAGFRVWTWEGRTCLDGILVAGPHGRGRRGFPLVSTQYRNPIHFGQDLFVLDVRGDLKPELSPNRAPPELHGRLGNHGSGWRRLSRLAGKAHGLLWKKVIERFGSEVDAKTLWQLLALHRAPLETLPRGFVWSRLLVPILAQDGSLCFRHFSELGRIPFEPHSAEPFAADESGFCVGADAEMDAWHDQNGHKLVSPALRSVVLSMAKLALREDKPALEFSEPEHPQESAFAELVFDHFSRRLLTIPFASGLDGVLVAVTSRRLLNKRHPVMVYLLSRQDSAVQEPEFAFLHCLAGALVEDGTLEALATGDFGSRQQNYHFSTLGFHFRNIDCGTLPPGCQPPYRCWLPGKGIFEIGQEILRKLGEIQEIDWHRREEPRFI